LAGDLTPTFTSSAAVGGEASLAESKPSALSESDAAIYRSFFENAVEGIFQTSPDGRYLRANPALARIYGYPTVAALIDGLRDIRSQLYVQNMRRGQFKELIQSQGYVTEFESEVWTRDGAVIWISENARLVRDEHGEVAYYEGTVMDITSHKQAALKLELLRAQLVEAARRDGMAEIATGVLHNVGNVLNSVNVSASVAAEKARRLRVEDLSAVSRMLEVQRERLGEFLTTDPRGQQVPDFLKLLAEKLTRDRDAVLVELTDLAKNIEHIKQIVATQQSYAGAKGLVETTPLAELLEDALRINLTSFERHGIQIVRELEDQVTLQVDKHRLLQILVNLIKNAKDAIKQARPRPGRVCLRICRSGNERVRIAVSDNGIGIEPELLTRIFSHGFTTKAEGHGFGLHASANAARQLGGSLTATSSGLGQGATFVLDLPIAPPQASES
jgi:PAS domain S-box-containing protein